MNNLNLRKRCFNTINGKSFVGLRFEDNQALVYFPLGYNIPSDDNECRISILNLLKSINLSKKMDDTSNNFGVGEFYEFPVNSFLWIINDYLSNGLYKSVNVKYSQNGSGKINWKRTFNTNFFVSGTNVIYPKFVVTKNSYEANLITEIQALCVNISIYYIGFLFGRIKRPACCLKCEFDFLNSNEFCKNIRYYISVIDKEFLNIFDDHKKTILINMKKILLFCSDKNGFKLKDFGISYYEYAFQAMVDYVFGNCDVTKYFPYSTWHILNRKAFRNTSLKPDTLLEAFNKLYILDSKYYSYGVTGKEDNLPHTDSVQKQITYADHVFYNNQYSYDKIFNAFIIPYNKYNNPFGFNKTIQYVGFSDGRWKENSGINLHDHVALILIDTKYLMDCYFKEDVVDLKRLIDSIEEVSSTF